MDMRESRLAAPLALIVVAAAVGACSGASMTFINRSDATVAFAPEIVVAPCTSISVGLETAREAFSHREELFERDDNSWVPDGARRFDRQISGRPIGSSESVTILISGTAEAAQIQGPLDRPLPPCGGEPVGIE